MFKDSAGTQCFLSLPPYTHTHSLYPAVAVISFKGAGSEASAARQGLVFMCGTACGPISQYDQWNLSPSTTSVSLSKALRLLVVAGSPGRVFSCMTCRA